MWIIYCGRAPPLCVYFLSTRCHLALMVSCTTKTNNTQHTMHAVGHINCWNMLKTGGRELIHRPCWNGSIARGNNIHYKYELTDWVVGADKDSASVEDDDNELGNGLNSNKDIYCDYNYETYACSSPFNARFATMLWATKFDLEYAYKLTAIPPQMGRLEHTRRA